MRVAILTNVDDNFSIADADLQRHESIIAIGVAIAESADKTAHLTYLPSAMTAVLAAILFSRVPALYAATDSVCIATRSFLVSCDACFSLYPGEHAGRAEKIAVVCDAPVNSLPLHGLSTFVTLAGSLMSLS
jgi:hypothetical protein